MINWDKVKHFTKFENWGDQEKIEPLLVYELDKFRDFISQPVSIHCAYAGGGHQPKSQHYIGRAVDIHVKGMTLFEAFIAASRFGFSGIGIYPQWNNPGLHLDIRLETIRAIWGQINGVYVNVDQEFLKYLIK